MILLDYADLILELQSLLNQKNLKVYYYIPPKIWAWNESRASQIKKFVDHLLVIFPFEVDFYSKKGIEAIYVGNPLLDEIEKNNYKFSLKSSKPIIALLPGSRKQEIETILPEMLKIVNSFTNYQFVVGATTIFSSQFYSSLIKQENVEIVFNETYGLLSNAKAALVTSEQLL